jgi:lipoprotein NlpD
LNPASFNLGGVGKGLGYFLVSLLLSLQVACSSKGGAPVYDRGAGHSRASSATTYTVRRGDTLYGIAWRYRLNYHQLGAWNGIKGPEYLIYPGQRLRLQPPPADKRAYQQTPGSSSSPPAVVRRTPPPTQPHPRPKPEVNGGTRHVPVVETSLSPQTNDSQQSNVPNKQTIHSLKLDWRWPTIGRIVQTFSSGDPERKGVRISGVTGQPVVAAEAGRVVYSGNGLVGYGNLVIIKHDADYLSAYGYNKKLLVNEGDKVARGEQIAQMGSPRNGADSMLHFEIRKEGRPINPLPLLPKR